MIRRYERTEVTVERFKQLSEMGYQDEAAVSVIAAEMGLGRRVIRQRLRSVNAIPQFLRERPVPEPCHSEAVRHIETVHAAARKNDAYFLKQLRDNNLVEVPKPTRALTFEEQLAAVERGARLVSNFVPSKQYDRTLGGVSSAL